MVGWKNKKIKLMFLKSTNAINFMMGLFIGLTIVNSDIIYNSIITVVSGSLFHIIKSVGSIST